MKKTKTKILTVLVLILLAGIYYYVKLPAINIHADGFWMFLLVVIAAVAVFYIGRRRLFRKEDIKASGIAKGLIGLFLLVVAVYLAGTLLSSPIINAKKYQKLLNVENGDFQTDIKELSFDQIPLLDRDSATLLGNRKMGSMVDMVSQFEVDELYSQINYQDKPVRVSPLRYANVIKWFTNTPGMREIGLCDVDEGLDDTFEDIAELAMNCRFRDCTHTNEPRCAVRQAIEDGSLSQERFELYRSLHEESRRSADMKAIAKARKEINRARRR